jgi:threonine dehydratase
MEALGAEVLFRGRTFDECREHAGRMADEEGLRYVHPANEALLIAGVATVTLEMLEAVPDLDFLFVALGGGSTAAGACIVAEAMSPDLRVIAVQSAQASAGQRSWMAGEIREAPMRSIAEGLATGSGYEMPQSVIRERLTDFLLVDDADMNRAVRVYLETCHALSELAGAAALAGALQARDRLQGARVGLVLSGANITVAQLRDALGGSPDR